jgi:beta-N-acetylhexosaminidase
MTFSSRRLWLTATAFALGSLGVTAATAGTASACATAPSASAAGAAGAGPTAGSASAAGRQAAVPDAPVVSGLTARQLAGQRVIYSYTGLTPPASLLALIRSGDAAGVIFFGDNITSHAQIAGVIRTLEAADASPSNPVRAPLLLMTDQEGGQVRRLSGAPVLSEKQIAQSAHPADQVKAAGRGAGENLKSVGMNVNLAPVLDVYRQAGNFIDQFGRSYSNHAHTVSWMGADFIRAQQQVGVAATAKHFPGLGAATRSQNTDLAPVTLSLSAAAIRGTDEAPYHTAIGAGVKLVMVSWAVYPALDRAHPAGLSPAIVGGELRSRLGFKGVTITDALGAGALRAFGTFGNRAELAATAGMDLVLCSEGHVGEGESAIDGLERGYLNGTLNRTAFTAAVTRVLVLRAGLPG